MRIIIEKKKAKFWFTKIRELEEDYYRKVSELEFEMQRDTDIDDICFVWVDGNVIGIGSEDTTAKLVHRDE